MEELPEHAVKINNDNGRFKIQPFILQINTFRDDNERLRGSLKTIRSNAFSDSKGKIRVLPFYIKNIATAVLLRQL